MFSLFDFIFVKLKRKDGKNYPNQFWCNWYSGYCKVCKHHRHKHEIGCSMCGCLIDHKTIWSNLWDEKEINQLLKEGNYIICDVCWHVIPKFTDCEYCEFNHRRDTFDVDAYLKEKYDKHD